MRIADLRNGMFHFSVIDDQAGSRDFDDCRIAFGDAPRVLILYDARRIDRHDGQSSQKLVVSVNRALTGAPTLMLLSPSTVGQYFLLNRFSTLSAILVFLPANV